MATSLKYPTFGNLQSWKELHKKYRNNLATRLNDEEVDYEEQEYTDYKTDETMTNSSMEVEGFSND